MNDYVLIGRQIAGYRIEKLLGRGGMAEVYYAWDESLARPAAVKVIGAALRGNQSYADRFVQEARAVSQWRHEHILQVYYAGQEDDVYFFAMEYIDGLNLEQVLSQYEQKGELIPHDDAIRAGRAIASALDYAHLRHVVHRDVKPSNVMVDKESRFVLADFGLAMDVQQGSMGRTLGTPHYVAPEQALNSADALPQSDLYSLGVILYEMLTGVVPFDDPSSMSVALKHLTEPPPAPRAINPNLSDQVEAVLLKALQKEPSKRYGSGAALMDALEEALRAQTESRRDLLVLPPPPAGVDGRPVRLVSHLSVVDSMRLSAPMSPPRLEPGTPEVGGVATPLAATATPLATTRRTASRRSPSQLLSLGGVGALVFLILALGAFLLMRGGTGATGASEEVATLPAAGAATDLAAAPTVVGASDQATVQPVANDEAAPTATAPDAAASAVTAPGAVPEAPAEPTVVFADGRRLELAYDANSFYLYNPSAEKIRISDITFEALDAAGRPLRYGMAGNRWTQFYAFLGEFACYRIEPFGMPGYLRPPYCRSYSATVTPAQNGDEIFWIERPGAAEFRVLWAGQEVARCPLGASSCVVFVPAE